MLLTLSRAQAHQCLLSLLWWYGASTQASPACVALGSVLLPSVEESCRGRLPEVVVSVILSNQDDPCVDAFWSHALLPQVQISLKILLE